MADEIRAGGYVLVPGRGWVLEGEDSPAEVEAVSESDDDVEEAPPPPADDVVQQPEAAERESGVTSTPTGPENGSEAFPRHVGGGTYELSDGSRVRGRDEAHAAEAELADV